MNQYLFEPELPTPAQQLLQLDIIARVEKSANRFSSAKTPEEVASIIADDMLNSIKDSFISTNYRALLTQ